MKSLDLSGLNPEQRQAVDAVLRHVLVMAPVGTGKTNVLAMRAARAIESGVPPAQILCLSFTNKAAREMKTRLAQLLGKAGSDVTAKTFHAFCAGVVRSEAPALGIDSDFLIYDEEDCRTLLGGILKRHKIEVHGQDAEGIQFLLFEAASRARLARWDGEPDLTPQMAFERELRQANLKYFDRRQPVPFKDILRDYIHELRDNHALDFTDLIAGVNRLWDEHPTLLDQWRSRHSWIQIDEVQDTSRAEYRVLSMLARTARSFSFFGDVDQTIYEWRGSVPHEILAEYRAEFAPVLEVPFVRNYRSTRNILNACTNIVKSMPGAVTKRIVSQIAEEGEPVVIRVLPALPDEAEWIRDRVEEIKDKHGLQYRDFAVLVRTNFVARDFAESFARLGLPHLETDRQKFFQRAEVKDAIAHLRLVASEHDGAAMQRFLNTPPKGIGEAAISALRGEPRKAGLKTTDLLRPETFQFGDPMAPLLAAMRASSVVVFDIETTGTQVGEDRAVEIAASRCGMERVESVYRAFIQPGKPVGTSEPIHGYSDEFLAAHGRDAAEVLREFAAFAEGTVLAGHNAEKFDVPFLASEAARVGVEPWPSPAVFDTMELTRRLYRLPRYRLVDICASLKIPEVPTHRAEDDVAATVTLLQRLARELEASATTRIQAVKKHARQFMPLARNLQKWRDRRSLERPQELLGRIIDESGLAEHYRKQTDGRKRVAHLEELVRTFETNDDATLRPEDSLQSLLALAALGSDVDRGQGDEDRVLILTVHQAKGLEFDTVFISHAIEGEFPSWRSVKEGRVPEEHRLLYVAASRAKQRLFITVPRENNRGRSAQPSRFLSAIRG
jgi:DNA helicase-2/ATP-dependent DNA helicase PcrA